MTERRTAIVTGSGKRVGRVLVEALLADGWSVVAHVHHPNDSVAAGATKVAADLADPNCARLIFDAAALLAPVRLLINNAARFAWDGFGEFSAAEFDAHMAVNVRAPALLIEELAKRHTDGDALAINLLDAKLSAPNPDYLSYTLSKSALAALTELAARAFAPRGIRVHGIAPALMLRSSGQSGENFEAMHANNPLGRGVQPADVAAAVRFLIQAATMTGQIITIDGGHRFLGLGRDVQFLEAE
jgi:NAD(P)-dependent dehydrogenase (short-subunit alcohol dehydrogenase family)